MQPYRSELDRKARLAFEFYCRAVGSYAEVADRDGIDHRTARRMFRQERTVPPGLARDIARHHEAGPVADDLIAWADHAREASDAAHE